MKKAMKKAPAKKMKTGGMNNPNKIVTVSTTPTPYKGGISKAPAGASTTPTKYTGGKDTPPKGAVPAAKYGTMMKKGGSVTGKKISVPKSTRPSTAGTGSAGKYVTPKKSGMLKMGGMIKSKKK